MKIGYVYDAVYPFVKGGGEKRIYEVARRLALRGHDVHIFGMKFWSGPDRFERDGVTYRSLGKAVPFYHGNGRRSVPEALRFGLQCWRLLAEHGFDVADCGQWPYFHFIPCKVMAGLRSTRFVVTWYEVWGAHWYEYLGRAGAVGKLVETAF